MYTEFYGLTALPFQLTPDPRFFFESSVHRRAVAHLMFGIEQSEGFIVVTGEVGAGKTTILGHLLATLDTSKVVAAKVVSTNLQAEDTLRSVASAFRLEFQGSDKATLLRRIEDFLVSNHARGLRTLLLIDEAQNLSAAALEELRMLSNFQVGAKVPLQSFLLGQPQFRRTLANPDLEQFRQRIIASYHLGPMGEAETAEYVRHRLKLVGWTSKPAFTDSAMAEIFRNTDGVPRRINVLCSRVLLHAFLDGLMTIDGEVVRVVAEDHLRENAQIMDSSDGVRVTAPMVRDTAVLDRLDHVERTVERHGRALQFFASLAESKDRF
ncbi:MAG: AAA family ATPase [Rhodospirillaceae bacterium]|nr:AAA family ATPase [Rhodospirillales bacterium]